MSFFVWLKKLYSLDTLDTRFTVSATTPLRRASAELQVDPARPSPSELGNEARARQNGQISKMDDIRPPMWKTPEFYFYYFLFLTIVPLMFWVSYQVSTPSHPNYKDYEHLLSPGWIPGRKVDNSDGQYASFRNHIPYLALVLLLHLGLRKLYDSFFRINTYVKVPATANAVSHGLSSSAAADARLEHRVAFDLYFAILLTVVLHGFSALKIFLILYGNYKIAKHLPRRYVPWATWFCNIAILFANELSRGYSFAALAIVLFPQTVQGSTGPELHPPEWAMWLDRHGGLVPRWEVSFGITILRLISFNLDYYWSQNQQNGSPIEKKQLDPSNLSERDRVSISAKPSDYTLRNYFAYALYSPLYLAGPIITFNDYISQQRYPVASVTRERTTLYAIRFGVVLLCMELVLHFIYAVAIFQAKPDWAAYTPFQLSMLGYFSLHIIWLKLLIIWRFFRLWALLDGIDPPENMARCMSDNYSALAFWRGWHRSYNRWIVRYIHVPLVTLGGRAYSTGFVGKARQIGSFLVVFTFVALWHDINLRLLIWGWLITIFVLPEIIATLAFPARRWRNSPNAYRVLCGVGAVFNILMLMVANLVGFAIGIDGLKGLVHGIIGSSSGVAFVAAACGGLFVGVQVMFEVREQEKREGFRMKC